jgi:hypothetical protein
MRFVRFIIPLSAVAGMLAGCNQPAACVKLYDAPVEDGYPQVRCIEARADTCDGYAGTGPLIVTASFHTCDDYGFTELCGQDAEGYDVFAPLGGCDIDGRDTGTDTDTGA